MFNSKKFKKVIQQQELLDAKVNLLTHSQKTLSEDFEVHFKRLRQSIYASVEDLSSELQDQMRSINKQLEELKNKNAESSAELFCKTISPIQDKMKFNPLDETITPPPLTEMAFSNAKSSPKRKRESTKPIDARQVFYVSVKLPEGVLNYLHNRSSSKSVSTTCRNVFERGGKLVFAPLSYEITKNFLSSKPKTATIQVSKMTYLAMRKIANELNTSTLSVASNFIASLDTLESMEIAMCYSKMSSKELQFRVTQKK